MVEFLKCKICGKNEIEVLGYPSAIFKKVKCLNCGFSNERKKEIEIEVISRKKVEEQ